MNTVSYAIKGLLRSFLGFFGDWYLVFPQIYWKKTLKFTKELDKSLAFREMARNWFSPLYQDYNIVGFLVGICIRTLWIIFDSIFYIFFFFFASLIFIIWLLILPCIIYLILYNLVP
ncbi:MAG: hypothetical protein WC242_02105 [Candidatus Paceibacterota bacterium]|jgi:hypothetical protein